MRKLIIWLISIQFIAFVILMITLIYEFCKRKNNKDKVEEAKDINENKENKKEEGKISNEKVYYKKERMNIKKIMRK